MKGSSILEILSRPFHSLLSFPRVVIIFPVSGLCPVFLVEFHFAWRHDSFQLQFFPSFSHTLIQSCSFNKFLLLNSRNLSDHSDSTRPGLFCRTRLSSSLAEVWWCQHTWLSTELCIVLRVELGSIDSWFALREVKRIRLPFPLTTIAWKGVFWSGMRIFLFSFRCLFRTKQILQHSLGLRELTITQYRPESLQGSLLLQG